MITPSFSITQDGQFLTIRIHAPYANIAESEVEYSERTFYFNAAPYFLRLYFPCEIVDDETGSTDYEADTGHFTVKVPKKNVNEHFPNLDMLNELLKPPTISARPAVEEIGEENMEDDAEIDDSEVYADQKLREQEKAPELVEITTYGYGFGWQRHNVFSRFDEDIVKKLVSIPSPDTFATSERVSCCVMITAEEFTSDHYLSDLLEPPENLMSTIRFDVIPSKHFEITQDDRDRMKDLPAKRVLPTVNDQAVAYSLIDIMAAYLYDFRFTEGDDNVESGWTITQLAPTLSFLVRWTLAEEAVVGFARRAVTKPCYRSWELLNIVLQDVVATFKQGRSALLHCLLQLQRIMNTSGDFRYLFNDLFITDYCLWIQSVDEAVLTNVTRELEEAVQKLTKADVDCDLEELELEANMYLMSLNTSGGSLTIEQVIPPLDSDDEEYPN